MAVKPLPFHSKRLLASNALFFDAFLGHILILSCRPREARMKQSKHYSDIVRTLLLRYDLSLHSSSYPTVQK